MSEEKVTIDSLEDKIKQMIVDNLNKIIKDLPSKIDVPVASGNLKNSMKFSVKVNGMMFSVVLNVADYYKYLDEGREPGKQPPIEAIEDWITVKNLTIQPTNGVQPTVHQLAYLIARKIGRDGIAPLNLTNQISNTIKTIYDK